LPPFGWKDVWGPLGRPLDNGHVKCLRVPAPPHVKRPSLKQKRAHLLWARRPPVALVAAHVGLSFLGPFLRSSPSPPSCCLSCSATLPPLPLSLALIHVQNRIHIVLILFGSLTLKLSDMYCGSLPFRSEYLIEGVSKKKDVFEGWKAGERHACSEKHRLMQLNSRLFFWN
jgi:hypothetical protein